MKNRLKKKRLVAFQCCLSNIQHVYGCYQSAQLLLCWYIYIIHIYLLESRHVPKRFSIIRVEIWKEWKKIQKVDTRWCWKNKINICVVSSSRPLNKEMGLFIRLSVGFRFHSIEMFAHLCHYCYYCHHMISKCAQTRHDLIKIFLGQCDPTTESHVITHFAFHRIAWIYLKYQPL